MGYRCLLCHLNTMAHTKKVILVVEDEGLILEAIGEKLTKKGYQPLLAHSVDEAMAHLAKGTPIDAVWLDHYLSDKVGLELATFMKREGSQYRDVPIFLVSNTASADKIDQYMKAGVKKYFVKTDQRLDGIMSEITASLSPVA